VGVSPAREGKAYEANPLEGENLDEGGGEPEDNIKKRVLENLLFHKIQPADAKKKAWG